MKEAYIINGVRTPVGSFGGSLASVRADDMAAFVIAELMKKNSSVDPAEIADVILGCANQAGEDNRNVARMALLLAGLPVTVPGETVNRLCASGMSACVNAARMIQTGDADLIIGGGVENMTRGPWVISKTSTPYGRDAQMYDSSFGWRFINPKMKERFGTDSMGETAENLIDPSLRGGTTMQSTEGLLRSARNDGDKITREDQDKFALWSQQKATKAQQRGRFAKEIVGIPIQQKKETLLFDNDEFIKPSTTLEILSKLKPAFRKDGSITAGNASGLNDGASALMLASENGIKKSRLKPLARLVSSAVVGVEPRVMGIGPVEASNRAIAKAGLKWDDIDIIELNEAFASQVLACTHSWGISDNDPRLNPNGGAIALGHPLGMSGARLLLTASIELQEQNKRYALTAMCIGVGQGYAVVLEKC